MDSDNPYAPPRAQVSDVIDPSAPLVPAERGTRFAATILDAIILTALVYGPIIVALVMVGITAGASGSFSEDSFDGSGLLATAGLGALAGFTVWCWLTVRFLRSNSQSIGKKLLGIKVVRADGTHASIARIVLLRNVVNTALSIVPLYGIVDALFIFGEPRQCLHDKLADTIVVRA